MSVPVNADKWTDMSFVQDVVYIPSDYNEQATSVISGFSSKGSNVTYVNKTIPTQPVIVIKINDRIRSVDNNLPSPVNLKAMQAESGVLLTREKPISVEFTTINGYSVYRKSSSENQYIEIGSLSGADNVSFIDIKVNSLNVCSYYVVAKKNNLKSDPSNYVTIVAPDRPNSIVEFSAAQSSKNTVELRWTNDYTKSFKETVLLRRNVNQTSYDIIKRCTPNETNYFDTQVIPGEKYIYQIKNMTSSGEYTNAIYDLVQIAYRDINTKTKVYIKSIGYNRYSDLESWPNGLPEFNISVLNVDRLNNNQSYKILDNRRFDMTRHSQQDCNILVLDGWEPKYWYDRMTYVVYEMDGGKDYTSSFNASFQFKTPKLLTEKLNLDSGSGLKIDIKYNASDEFCGTAFSDFYDPLSKWIECNGAGGVRLLIQDKL